MNHEYLIQFDQAIKFTKEMGLDCPEFILESELDFTQQDRELLINAILHEVYIKSKLQIEDVAMKCFWVSRELQNFLKLRFDLNSVITSGYLYSSGFAIYHESKESIKDRLTNPNNNSPIRFHTWITLTNHLVLDLALPPTLWFEGLSKGIQGDKESAKKMAWFDYKITDKKFGYYEPIFLGYDYFSKANIIPRLNFFYT